MKRVAIIPARSGSKGVPNKNIIDFCGKPLMVYAIEEAQKSGLFDRIVVSTDSEEYAKIATDAGAEVSMRPPELATDTASSYVVIKHVLEEYLQEKYDYFMLLQVTSPLRTAQHMIESATLFEQNYKNGINYVVSVKQSEVPSSYIFTINEDNTFKKFNMNNAKTRRQDYEPEYQLNGAIYIAKPDEYIKSKRFCGDDAMVYIMNDIDSVDIDNWLDYDFARMLMEKRIKNGK